MKALRFCVVGFCAGVMLYANTQKEQATQIDDTFSTFSLFAHSSDIGDLKAYPIFHGLWFDFGYAKQSSKSTSALLGSKDQNFLVKLGYDHAFRSRKMQDFLGFSVEYAHTWRDWEDLSGDADSLALSLYNVFLHPSNFYLHTAIKSVISWQKMRSDFTSAMIVGEIEMGYRKGFAKYLFFQPLVSVSGGYIPKFLTSSYYPLFVRAGGMFGVNFSGGVVGDVHLGAFFDSDFFFRESTLARSNYRLMLKFGSNVHFNQKVRLFLGVKTSFFGRTNMDYGINATLRILLGRKIPSQKPINTDPRGIKDVQKELLYQSQLSQQRIKEKHHLKPQDLNNRYETQSKRSADALQEEDKYLRRERMIKESSTWVDTRPNQNNYINRNVSNLRGREMTQMKNYYQKEMERKYGK